MQIPVEQRQSQQRQRLQQSYNIHQQQQAAITLQHNQPTAPPSSSERRQLTTLHPQLPLRNLFSTISTIHVGPSPNPLTFLVHREALCSASRFFAAALNPSYAPSFLEASSGVICLPDCRPQDFQYLVQWLYTGGDLTHEEICGPHPAYFRLIKLYALADRLDFMGLRNDILDKIAEVADETNSVPTPDDTRTIDAELPPESRLKKLVVDLFVWKKTDVVLETHPDSWCEGFLRELVVRLKRMPGEGAKSAGAPWRAHATRCERYHEHSSPAIAGGEDESQSCCKGRCEDSLPRKKSTEFKKGTPKKVVA